MPDGTKKKKSDWKRKIKIPKKRNFIIQIQDLEINFHDNFAFVQANAKTTQKTILIRLGTSSIGILAAQLAKS